MHLFALDPSPQFGILSKLGQIHVPFTMTFAGKKYGKVSKTSLGRY